MGIPHADGKKGGMLQHHPKSPFPAQRETAHPFLAPAGATQQLALMYFAFVYSNAFYHALQVSNIKWLLITFQ